MLGRCWADATMTAEPIQSSDSSSSLSEPSKEYSILGSCQDKKSSTGEPDGSLPESRCCASPLDPSKATYNQGHKGDLIDTTQAQPPGVIKIFREPVLPQSLILWPASPAVSPFDRDGTEAGLHRRKFGRTVLRTPTSRRSLLFCFTV
jgi:hypothetical protein